MTSGIDLILNVSLQYYKDGDNVSSGSTLFYVFSAMRETSAPVSIIIVSYFPCTFNSHCIGVDLLLLWPSTNTELFPILHLC